MIRILLLIFLLATTVSTHTLSKGEPEKLAAKQAVIDNNIAVAKVISNDKKFNMVNPGLIYPQKKRVEPKSKEEENVNKNNKKRAVDELGIEGPPKFDEGLGGSPEMPEKFKCLVSFGMPIANYKNFVGLEKTDDDLKQVEVKTKPTPLGLYFNANEIKLVYRDSETEKETLITNEQWKAVFSKYKNDDGQDEDGSIIPNRKITACDINGNQETNAKSFTYESFQIYNDKQFVDNKWESFMTYTIALKNDYKYLDPTPYLTMTNEVNQTKFCNGIMEAATNERGKVEAYKQSLHTNLLDYENYCNSSLRNTQDMEGQKERNNNLIAQNNEVLKNLSTKIQAYKVYIGYLDKVNAEKKQSTIDEKKKIFNLKIKIKVSKAIVEKNTSIINQCNVNKNTSELNIVKYKKTKADYNKNIEELDENLKKKIEPKQKNVELYESKSNVEYIDFDKLAGKLNKAGRGLSTNVNNAKNYLKEIKENDCGKKKIDQASRFDKINGELESIFSSVPQHMVRKYRKLHRMD